MTSDQQQWLDKPGSVRADDAFDVALVHAWLREYCDELPDELPRVEQYAKGASNLTYKLTYGDVSFVLRRPPVGHKAASAHNMAREYRIQKALAATNVAVPAMVALCEDTSVIGAEFYVMAHVEGLILRSNLPPGCTLSTARIRELSEAAIHQLLAIHAVDVESSGLVALGKGEGYNRRQIDGWSRRFIDAKTWNVFSGQWVMDWLSDHCPTEVAHCLVHGDYRFDNLVLEPNLADDTQPIQIKAILDWELATIGDPLMDLGNAMAYWVHADDDAYFRGFRRQPTHLAGMLTREEVVALYCEHRGIRVDHWAFYEVYGLFRLAVIAQQIYYRFHHKQTRNAQFKRFWLAVNYLLWRCHRIIKQAK